MYIVNFAFKNSSSALSFTFKAFKNAEEAFKKGKAAISSQSNSVVELQDDYEQFAVIDMETVSAVNFANIEVDMNRQGEVSIIQNKAQLRAQNLANNDASLHMLSSANRPSIISGN